MVEPDFADLGRALEPLAARLRAFAVFNGCDNIAVEQTQPKNVKAPPMECP